MKVLAITLLCAVASCAASGAVAWPGAIAVSAPLLKTIIPGETKTTAYSTTQYINAVPTSYAFAAQPQYAFQQVPQVNSFASYQPVPAYYSLAGHSYIPAANIFYPPAPAFGSVIGSGFPAAPAYPSAPAPPSSLSPIAPAYPGGSPSFPPSQQAGDVDSAVVDSANFNEEQQRQDLGPSPSQPPAPEPTQPTAPQFPPSNNFPNLPNLPQIPQESGQVPEFPQFPQVPQIPGFPQSPFPQGPSSPPSNFPAASNGDNTLSDEDTIAVESA